MAEKGVIFSRTDAELIRRVVKQILGEPGVLTGLRQPTRLRVPSHVFFRVDLTQTGGSNGTKTTAASWTYTAKKQGDSTVTLGTVLAPERTRENGTRTAATKGSGYYNNAGDFVLAEAWESHGTGGC